MKDLDILSIILFGFLMTVCYLRHTVFLFRNVCM